MEELDDHEIDFLPSGYIIVVDMEDNSVRIFHGEDKFKSAYENDPITKYIYDENDKRGLLERDGCSPYVFDDYYTMVDQILQGCEDDPESFSKIIHNVKIEANILGISLRDLTLITTINGKVIPDGRTNRS